MEGLIDAPVCYSRVSGYPLIYSLDHTLPNHKSVLLHYVL